jgi:flagellar biosynthetic protein FlhB
MANDGRTEKPTPRRKREARREGRVTRSPEVSTALSLLAAIVVLRAFVPRITHVFVEQSRTMWASAGDGRSLHAIPGTVLKLFALGAAPFAAAALLFGVVGGLVQTGFAWAPKAAKPKLSNLDVKRGLQRLSPKQAGWQLAKEALKLGLFVAAIFGPVRSWMGGFDEAQGLSPWVRSTASLVGTIFVRALALALFIAAVDYFVNRRRLQKSLRMSKQELKEEYKQHEGDPHVKAARKRRAHALTRNRMLQEVASADVVIVNPTHFAVALSYADGDVAPKVVAKGRNHMALKIRSIASRHGVLVQHDPPLARSLHRQCQLGQYVPAALYEAVAVVIAAAFRRRQRGIA